MKTTFIFKSFIAILVIFLVISVIAHFVLLPYYDKTNNEVINPPPYHLNSQTRDFHNKAYIADLHADSLLWSRALSKQHEVGHIDLPRLRQGGVNLQVFSVVSKVPKSLNYFSNRDDSDILPLLFIASWRSPLTWFSPRQRALVQASDLTSLADSSQIGFVRSKKDLSSEGLKGLLALEGMHALEGDNEALEEFFHAGFRMMGLTHFFDNEVAGSAHGTKKYGLTDFGRRIIPRMEALGITIDLAHASPAAIADTLELARKPVVVSHTGVQGTCPGPRNLSDSQLKRIAKNGGVIGIGFWKGAVCDPGVEAITNAILYAVKVAGIDYVALGSDFDGHVTMPFDVTGLPMLTESLLASGLSEDQIVKIMGDNVRRVLRTNLPQ